MRIMVVSGETFGQTVRRLRRDRRWSQERLGEIAGLDQSTVSQVELDKAEPTSTTVKRLATALERPQDEFLRLAGIIDDIDTEAQPYEPAIEKFRNLSERPRLAAQLRQFDQFDDSLAEAVENVVIALIDQRRRGESQDH